MKFYTTILAVSSIALTCTSCRDEEKQASTQSPSSDQQAQVQQEEASAQQNNNAEASSLTSLRTLEATQQAFIPFQPWEKTTPGTIRAFCIYLGNNTFLVNASVVKNATFLQIILPDGSARFNAVVKAMDLEIDIALVSLAEPKDLEKLGKLVPVTVGDTAKLNSKVQFWQYNPSGVPIVSDGDVQASSTVMPPYAPEPLQANQVKSTVTPTLGNTSIPMMQDNKIVGLSVAVNTSTQQISVLPAHLIKTFINHVESGTYVGLPSMGIQTASLTDKVFRAYLKLDADNGGVYVTKVTPKSSADTAGIKQGDVIISVAGKKVDNKGIITDDLMGPVPFTYITHDKGSVGDKVTVELRRDGEPVTVELSLNRNAIDTDIIPNTISQEQPEFIIHGGIVFQRLTSQFLREACNNDINKTPIYMQDAIDAKEEWSKEGYEQLIFISRILPTSATMSYERIGGCIVRKVDGELVKNFSHLAQLLDAHPENDILDVEINQPPYHLYLSKQAIAESNSKLEAILTRQLRNIRK